MKAFLALVLGAAAAAALRTPYSLAPAALATIAALAWLVPQARQRTYRRQPANLEADVRDWLDALASLAGRTLTRVSRCAEQAEPAVVWGSELVLAAGTTAAVPTLLAAGHALADATTPRFGVGPALLAGVGLGLAWGLDGGWALLLAAVTAMVTASWHLRWSEGRHNRVLRRADELLRALRTAHPEAFGAR